MRILLLNWRDVRSARGGGAELVTHRVARGLVERGHEVTWLSSLSDGQKSEEFVDGVRVIRRGSEVTTRFFASRTARRIRPDVVLEEINTLPYLSPLWSKVPVLLYMNQLARDVWWYEAPLLVAAAGFVAEPLYLQAYRRCDAVTISASTRDDLRRVGLGGTISIAPMVADVERLAVLGEKGRTGALVAVGRLTPSKRYDHAISALVRLRLRYPAATLTLIGDGRSRQELERTAEAAGVAEVVHFLGRISEAEKIAILTASDALVGTSVREGWGLTVSEAAARGTPSVAYDIPGFRDSVVDARTGLLVQPRPEALADGIARLLDDRELYDRLRMEAWRSGEPQTHTGTIGTFERALERARLR